MSLVFGLIVIAVGVIIGIYGAVLLLISFGTFLCDDSAIALVIAAGSVVVLLASSLLVFFGSRLI